MINNVKRETVHRRPLSMIVASIDAPVTGDVILQERHEAVAHDVQIILASSYGSQRSDTGGDFLKGALQTRDPPVR